jgi:hypothetical protein
VFRQAFRSTHSLFSSAPVVERVCSRMNSSTLQNSEIMATDDFSDFAYFSDSQYIVLAIVGLLSSTLSILGSAIILNLLIRGERTGELYQRLVLGLSISDLFMSVSLFLQPFLTPKETGYPLALGNSSTCKFLGFSYLFFISSYTYNCMLGIYFLAVVRYHASSQSIARCLEPWGHLFAFGAPIAIGSVSVRYDLLNANPFLGACTLFPTDHECTWKDGVECENDSAHNVLNSTLDFYAISMGGIGLICTIFVRCTVRSLLKANLELDANRNVSETNQEIQAKRIRTIGIQAVRYAFAYMVGLICVIVANVIEGVFLEDSLEVLGDEPLYFAAIFMLWMFFPLQGFFNCLIYIRPRWVRWKSYYEGNESNESKSWWFAFRKALSLQPPPRWGRFTDFVYSHHESVKGSQKHGSSRRGTSKKGRSQKHQKDWLNDTNAKVEDPEDVINNSGSDASFGQESLEGATR